MTGRSPSNTTAARKAVVAFRNEFLKHLARFKCSNTPIAALHNNSGSSYTIRDYLGSGLHAEDAEEVLLGAPQSPEDFMLTTTRDWFERLARCRRFNLVLQGAQARHDGSLSIWARGHGRPHVDVKTLHGRKISQQDMLADVARAANVMACSASRQKS